MNFLQLCQRLRQEAGVAGDGPTAVTGQTGQLARLVGWVNQSWIDIQESRPNWLFMHGEFSFNTEADVRDYVASDKGITDFKAWDTGSFLIYDPDIGAADEGPLEFRPYRDWYAQYRSGMAARETNRPALFTVLPNNAVRFESCPNGIYTISGNYKRSTQIFAANNDEPTGFPEEYHLLIVWLALQQFAGFYNAPELMDKGETQYSRLLYQLENEQLPQMDTQFRSLA